MSILFNVDTFVAPLKRLLYHNLVLATRPAKPDAYPAAISADLQLSAWPARTGGLARHACALPGDGRRHLLHALNRGGDCPLQFVYRLVHGPTTLHQWHIYMPSLRSRDSKCSSYSWTRITNRRLIRVIRVVVGAVACERNAVSLISILG